jgi:5-methylcytosine-specific restriction endonuclease McrA
MCLNKFKTTDTRRAYCYRCANVVRQSKRKKITLECFNCGKKYETYSSNHKSIYCSDKCRDYIARRKQNGNVYRYKRNAHYKSNIEFESDRIIYDKVFCEHGYICNICGNHIDSSLRFPHSMSASIDHVIPISKGGTHTYDNIRPAHLSCNCRKGCDLEEQPGAGSVFGV